MKTQRDVFVGVWVRPSDDPLKQVGRHHTYEELKLVVEEIVRALNIRPDDVVLDVCCGNGIITKMVSRYCKEIHGVDYSEVLISTAKEKNSGSNIHYYKENALNIDRIFPPNFFDKCYCQLAFQYFNGKTGKELIRKMATVTKKGGLIYIGEIPDKTKIWRYYDTPRKKLRFIKKTVMHRILGKGEDSLGWWWHPDQIERICRELNLQCKIMYSDERLPHAYYRFNALIKIPEG